MSSSVEGGGDQPDPTGGLLFSLAGVAVSSTVFVSAKHGVEGFNPSTFSLVWTASAALYALTYVLVMGHGRQLKPPPVLTVKVMVLGLVAGAGMLTSWGGLALLSPSFVAFLWRFASIFTIILGSLLLHEHLGMKELPAAGVIVLGSLLSAVGQWNLVAAGMGLTIIACVLAGVQNVLAKMVVADVHPSVLCVYRLGLGAVWVALWTFGTGRADFDVAPSHWWATLGGALLGPWLSWLLFYEAYRRWALWRATLISMLQPLFVIPIAYVAFGDLPSAKEFVGGALIMVGAAWFVRGHLETKKLARSDGRA